MSLHLKYVLALPWETRFNFCLVPHVIVDLCRVTHASANREITKSDTIIANLLVI